jgi:hypothetical protein
MNPELSDEETAACPEGTVSLSPSEREALIRELHDIVENDRYPFSPRIRTLREILNKLRPEPRAETGTVTAAPTTWAAARGDDTAGEVRRLKTLKMMLTNFRAAVRKIRGVFSGKAAIFISLLSAIIALGSLITNLIINFWHTEDLILYLHFPKPNQVGRGSSRCPRFINI